MQRTHRPQPQSASLVTNPIQPARPSSPALYMQWTLVDGKLSCRWLQQPD